MSTARSTQRIRSLIRFSPLLILMFAINAIGDKLRIKGKSQG